MRDDVRLTEIPGPTRLAPYTIALEGELLLPQADGVTEGERDYVDGPTQGRFVVLYNPAGDETWQGEFRIVVLVSADLDAELTDDPMVDDFVWSWLTDLLDEAGLEVAALGGTVTRLLSTSFGIDAGSGAELEIRASWTPLSPDLAPHLRVWTELIATAGGVEGSGAQLPQLEPVPEGVTPISTARHPRPH